VIKDYVTLAAQCGVPIMLPLAHRPSCFRQSGVTKDIADKDQVMGFRAVNRKEALHEDGGAATAGRTLKRR